MNEKKYVAAGKRRFLEKARPWRPGKQASSVMAAVASALYGMAASADEATLQEVTVTATHRAISAQDLPISITAISGATLDQAGIEDINALAQSMAGVTFTDKGPFSGISNANLIIRGLNSEATAGLPALASPIVAPVATYVDDTALFFNLRLQDLDRVEVLRGPQGTLYGAGSLGGTIRFVQNAPSLSGFDAKAEVGVSDTAHTSEPNEEVFGMLNLPLSDTFAVRLNAGGSYDAGFINQPNLYRLSGGVPVPSDPGNLFSPPEKYDAAHTNDYQYRSARVAALWKPNDVFKAQLSYYYQLDTAGGFPYVATSAAAFTGPISAANQLAGSFSNPALASQLYPASVPAGVDSLSNADNGRSSTNDRVDLVALTLDFDLGFATLTSSSSGARHANRSVVDETDEYTNFPFFQSFYGQNPRTFVVGDESLDDRPWSEEIRLASKTGGAIDWLVGAFYKYETTQVKEADSYPGYLAFYNACEPVYGQSAGDGVTPSYCGLGESAYTPGSSTSIDGIPVAKDLSYISAFSNRFQDRAIFGDVTWHASSAWSLTGGTRLFDQTLSQTAQNALLFDGPDYFFNNKQSNEWRKALWKANTAYQINDQNLVYATWSQGFRRGAVNALPGSELGGAYVTPASLMKVAPDTANNYEIGFKGTLYGRLQYSADIFDVQWKNIQEGVELTPLVLVGALNIGDGYSRGTEEEFTALLTDHLTAHLDYTYDQTKLTSINPAFREPDSSYPPPATGGALPGTPRNSIAAGFQYEHAGFSDGSWRYALNAHYQSTIVPALSATVPSVPGFTMLDTRVTYSIPHWSASFYVTNLTNRLGITAYQDPSQFGNRNQAIISQPRTVGLTLDYRFLDR